MGATPPDNKTIAESVGKDWSADISVLSREPFREILRNFLKAEPTVENVHIFANKYPDRWAQAVTIMARLADYKETTVVEHNFYARIQVMSDAELKAALIDNEKQLELLEGKVVSVEEIPDTQPVESD